MKYLKAYNEARNPKPPAQDVDKLAELSAKWQKFDGEEGLFKFLKDEKIIS